jgi:hypothetical protein
VTVATSFTYGNYPLNALSKKADWLNDTVKAALLLNTYTPDQDNHIWVSNLTGEATGGGYARQTLATKTLVYSSVTNTTKLSCADVTFTGLTLTGVRYLVFFHDTGVAGTSPLVAYVDFGSDQNPSSQSLTYTVPAAGITAFAVA